MKRILIRRSRIQKLFLGCHISNGKKAGRVDFKNDLGDSILVLYLAPYSGFQPYREPDCLPMFQEPIPVKGLSVLKPNDCNVQVVYSIEGDSNLYSYLAE